jgi:protein phosphatase 1 regulatory subunit 7
LWLGRNKIRQIDGLRNLVNLRRLDVQNNRLAKLQGLETLIHLEELYVGHNGLTSLEGLDSLVRGFKTFVAKMAGLMIPNKLHICRKIYRY